MRYDLDSGRDVVQLQLKVALKIGRFTVVRRAVENMAMERSYSASGALRIVRHKERGKSWDGRLSRKTLHIFPTYNRHNETS